MKRKIQRLLARLGLYYRLKESALYGFYWRLLDRRQVQRRSNEVNFYRAVLQGLEPDDIVFDVGANEGNKTSVFLRLGAKVVAVEPDRTNQDALSDRFLKLRFGRPRVTIVPAALSYERGAEMMWVDEPGSAKNTLNKKWVETLRSSSRFGRPLSFPQQAAVQTRTLEDLIEEFGQPFFVKIDVEGAEPQVLRGLQRPVPFVSFETNLPEFLPEGLECVDLLERLAPGGTFNYTVDCEAGLAIGRWVSAAEFKARLQACSEPSVDVIWASGVRWLR